MPTIIGNIKRLIKSKLDKSKNRDSSNNLSDRAEMNAVFRFKYTLFKELLAANSELLNILSDIEEKLKGKHIFGASYIKSQTNRSLMHSFKMVKNLNVLSGSKYPALYEVLNNLNNSIKTIINEKKEQEPPFYVILYSNILKKDADWVGGKNANLGEIKNKLDIPVPEGFAITTRAFNYFLDMNDLRKEILKRKNLIDIDDVDNIELLNRLSKEVVELIESKPIPDAVVHTINSSYQNLFLDHIEENKEITDKDITGGNIREKNIRVAMRSSAIGEDGELSFAGQYLTILNVTPDNIAQAYKSIIASLYSARSISYRISKGIYDDDLAMAVACIKMVDSAASGVMYTRHPYNIIDENIIINSVWGLGPYAVDGIVIPDTFIVQKSVIKKNMVEESLILTNTVEKNVISKDMVERNVILKEHFEKDNSDIILSRNISNKRIQLVCNFDEHGKDPDEIKEKRYAGGVKEIEVPIEKQSVPSLSDDQIKELAYYAVKLEEHYKCPQDIEWAVDKNGKVMILQSRPLKLKALPSISKSESKSEDVDSNNEKAVVQLKPAPIQGCKVIIDESEVASQGIGAGKAFHLKDESDLVSFPKGAVLIAHHSSPEYVVVMKDCSGIITESGSVSGHMAALAREFNVPALMGFGAQNALDIIPNGMEITIDAYAGRVYQGIVTELISAVKKEDAHMKGTQVYELLDKVSQLMTPLYLINPKASEFTPSGCKTLHDIARFCHERSYIEMFNVSDIASKRHKCSVQLEASLPIDLHIINIGSGFKPSQKIDESNICGGRISINDIKSVPFLALVQGMLNKNVNNLDPRPVNLSGLLSVMQEQMLSPGHVGERFGDRSYAIIADKYLNFSSRVGYHYSVVDAYCGETVNKNYITFSFKGGAADETKRIRRVKSIAMILKAFDFIVDIKEDKVDARLQKYPCSFIQNRLDMLGKLLIFTRQMDMLMTEESKIEWVAQNFIDGNYKLAI